MATELWTIQLGSWRKAKAQGIEVIDITVRTGNKVFAPTWEMVESIKTATPENKSRVEENYCEQYRLLMRQSWINNRAEWLALLNKPKIALACYCKAGDFCHRVLLVEYLLTVAARFDIKVNFKGELQ